ncbi:BTAD domain-containing putative transcriptional regulator [Actinophytocola sp.]|uniref:AfsR/SARP family transcriptional regulator n=1 Tax=Actinophytocola sp. TaxID=1872138 RepID=UPI0025C57DE9|nr:BTAD domain-containing putative transcriptional regulator [Actinophytocola sp.]
MFRVLGAVEADAAAAGLGGPRQRCLLGLLLLEAGRVVPAGRIAEAIWGDDPPANSRNSIQATVSRLRRVLTGVGLVARGDGYALEIDPRQVDLHRFRELVGLAREAAESDGERAAALYEQALALWRGAPLADVSSDLVRQRLAPALERERLAARLDQHDVLLALGRAAELASVLLELVDEHPFEQRLCGQLMRTLAAVGRPTEGLAAYQALRARLADELGLDPAEELRELEVAILRGEPQPGGRQVVPPAQPPPAATDSPEPRPTPAQLPADVADFTGRAAVVSSMRALLTEPAAASRVLVISGPGGIGKSALAHHVAHQVRGHYPDGQLHATLRGATATPVDTGEVMAGFLRALRVSDIPQDLSERESLYRSVLADRRVLIVLDDARDAAQVRPLLPGATACAVLVTTRPSMANLVEAKHVPLSPLTPGETTALFASITGAPRVAAEPAAADEVAAACGGLPLAVRVAAGRLVARPAWGVATLATRLRNRRHLLDELRLGDLQVRVTFQVSYQVLPEPTARAFRTLGVLDHPEQDLPAVAALLGLDLSTAETVLEELVDTCLLDCPAPSRYRLHDLLHAFARELAEQRLSAEERADALHRVADFATATALNANRVLRPLAAARLHVRPPESPVAPDFATRDSAMSWYRSSWTALLSFGEQCLGARAVPSLAIAQLFLAVSEFPFLEGNWTGAELVARAALRTAEAADEPVLVAHANDFLARSLIGQRRDAESTPHHEACLREYRSRDLAALEANVLNNMSVRLMNERKHELAKDHAKRSVELAAAVDDEEIEASAMGNLGLAFQMMGHYQEANELYQRALVRYTDLGDTRAKANVLNNCGNVMLAQGDFESAVAYQTEALDHARATGQRDYSAEALLDLATAYRLLGRLDDAAQAALEALAERRDMRGRHGEGLALLELGKVSVDQGDTDRAWTHWTHAKEIFVAISAPEAADTTALLAGLPKMPRTDVGAAP